MLGERRSMQRKGVRSLGVVLLVGLAALLLSAPARAGNGTFANGVYDFCVSVRFNATAAELAQIRTAFQNASQVFADATDGQQRFGTVTIVNNSGASQSADYWVHPGADRARATLGRYGERGHHVNLYFLSNFQAQSGADGDAYTIAHEHAHHAFGVVDEYSGPGPMGTVSSAECAPPGNPDPPNLNFSLMDNYFTRGGQAQTPAGPYTLNEFCVAANHDPDGDTFQTSRHAQSAWETIAAHPKRAAVAPVGLPTDAPPAPHVVTFEDGIAGLRVVLLLDRSGSMAAENRLEFAKRGGKLFVDQLRTGDEVGVASFSCSTGVDFPLTPIGGGTAAAAKTAIDGLAASGSTNIGGGLLAALGALTAQADRSCNEIIVLLSDGDHNCGTAPSTVIPQLQAEGVTAFTVGVGGGISASGQATLQSIATSTSGRYFRVANSFQLVGLYLRLVFESLGDGLLTQAPLTIGSNQALDHSVLVEAGSQSATFALAIADDSDDVSLALQTPSGDVIDEAAAAIDPDVDFFADSNSRLFRVRNPEAGVWSMLIASRTVTDGRLEALAFSANDGLQLNLALEDETPDFPQPTQIEATPTFAGLPVRGAEVGGRAVRPDGSAVAISLFDDGSQEHGDLAADDGVYSAFFASYTEDGTYSFELTVDNATGSTAEGESLFEDQPSNPLPVPPMTRSASIAAVVTGTPGVLSATVELMPEPLDLSRSGGGFVQGFIELPTGLDPADIDPSTVAIVEIDGAKVQPIGVHFKHKLGDFDNDGIPDLRVAFRRQDLLAVVPAGLHTLRIEGLASGQLFVGIREISVVR